MSEPGLQEISIEHLLEIALEEADNIKRLMLVGIDNEDYLYFKTSQNDTAKSLMDLAHARSFVEEMAFQIRERK